MHERARIDPLRRGSGTAERTRPPKAAVRMSGRALLPAESASRFGDGASSNASRWNEQSSTDGGSVQSLLLCTDGQPLSLRM